MKNVIVLFIGLVFFSIGAIAQNGAAGTRYKGKILFVNALPTDEYVVVGKAKYSNSKKNEQMTIGDVSGMAKVIVALDEINEKVEKGKHDGYDAAVVISPTKIELIKFTTKDATMNRLCVVGAKGYKKKFTEKVMHFMSIPVSEYDVVKVIEVKNFTNLGQLKMGKNDIDNFLNKLYERSIKEAKKGLDFDAVLYNDPNIVNDRGFLSAKTVELIKYK